MKYEVGLPMLTNPTYEESPRTIRKGHVRLIDTVTIGTVQAAASSTLLAGKASERISSRHHGALPGQACGSSTLGPRSGRPTFSAATFPTGPALNIDTLGPATGSKCRNSKLQGRRWRRCGVGRG